MKRLLEGLSAVNASAHHFGGYFGYKGHESSENPFPESVHPVVRTHPETGRKALYVNETFTTRIVELQPEESKAVLALLYRHIASPRFQCRVRWRPGTTVMWGQPLHPAPRAVGLLPADALGIPLHDRGRAPAMSTPWAHLGGAKSLI